MFQSGVNRDSKSLDACVRIEILLGTNGDRPGNNSFRSVPTSLLYFLKSRGDPFSLCTYTRKYIQAGAPDSRLFPDFFTSVAKCRGSWVVGRG